jgi:hypothetical protein
MLEEFNILNFFIIFFGFFIIITVIALVFSVYMARLKNKTSKKEINDNPNEKVIEKETIKEIVMVPCVYCGSLMPQTALFCNTCGAGRKA